MFHVCRVDTILPFVLGFRTIAVKIVLRGILIFRMVFSLNLAYIEKSKSLNRPARL